jgi:hypothetical protein
VWVIASSAISLQLQDLETSEPIPRREGHPQQQSPDLNLIHSKPGSQCSVSIRTAVAALGTTHDCGTHWRQRQGVPSCVHQPPKAA